MGASTAAPIENDQEGRGRAAREDLHIRDVSSYKRTPITTTAVTASTVLGAASADESLLPPISLHAPQRVAAQRCAPPARVAMCVVCATVGHIRVHRYLVMLIGERSVPLGPLPLTVSTLVWMFQSRRACIIFIRLGKEGLISVPSPLPASTSR